VSVIEPPALRAPAELPNPNDTKSIQEVESTVSEPPFQTGVALRQSEPALEVQVALPKVAEIGMPVPGIET
jgi:hypothetical protein